MKKEKITETKVVPVKEKTIAKASAVANTPDQMIMVAINKGLSPESLDRLFTLQERYEANLAKKAFDKAMADFQGEVPVIKKVKRGGQTKTGQTAYMYAPLDSIVEQVQSLLKKNGLSYMIKIDIIVDEKKETKVKATCIARHYLGHSEESTMEVPLGAQTGVMSQPQVVAAASTFAKRYAFQNAFGIMTGDEDNENALKSNSTQTVDPDIIPEMIKKVNKLFEKSSLDKKKYLDYFKVDDMDQLTLIQLQMLEKTIIEKMQK